MEALLEAIQIGLLSPPLAILGERSVYQRQQFLGAERLCQKIQSSCLDRAHARRNAAVACDKNDRRMRSVAKPSLKVQAVDVRKLDIEDQTGGYVGRGMGDVCGC